MNTLTALSLAFPLVLVISLLFDGIDRKVHARMQKRIGPPIIQPFYDFVKLFNKERIVPITASSRIFTAMPLVAAAASILGAAIPLSNIIAETSIVGDLILVLYLLTMSSIALMVGGSSSGNPYGAIGFSRKMSMMIAYEVPLLIAIASLAFNPCHSLTIHDVVWTQIKMRSPLAFSHLSGTAAATAFLLCIPAAAMAVPFDIPEAKTEVVHGILVEYGGPYLALIKLAKATSSFALTFLAATLFFYIPALFEGSVSLGRGGNLLLCLAAALAFMLLTITVPRTVFARLKIGQAFKFYWIIPLMLSVASVALSVLGL